jgi:hypothetical protein
MSMNTKGMTMMCHTIANETTTKKENIKTYHSPAPHHLLRIVQSLILLHMSMQGFASIEHATLSDLPLNPKNQTKNMYTKTGPKRSSQ